jgi:cell division cycle 14
MFLMGAFMIVILKMDATEAFSKFEKYQRTLKPFRDASKGECFFECTVLHCLQGLQFGVKEGWYNFRTFDVKEYEYYERVEHGDLNWIIPGKFIAFMGPVDHRPVGAKSGFTPEEYL